MTPSPWTRRRLIASLGAAPLWASPLIAAADAAAQQSTFAAWLRDFKRDAGGQGISRATLDAAFRGIRPNPRIVELDGRQPEFTQTFWSYISRAVADIRIERGRSLLAKHRRLLSDVAARHGVQPRFLMAFWGLESNFGDNTGGFPVIEALTTLAFDPRRATFFRAQLLDALRIIDQGHIRLARMTGSWAGAMGQLQFIPSTFTAYAIDADGDGRRDIWNSLPDVFGSAANYLRSIGWRSDQTWGREVRLPAGFDWNQASLEVEKPLRRWADLGVRAADGQALPLADFDGSIILPGGYRGPAFLVYGNFRVIMRWNRSIFYAIAIGRLSDRIAGGGALVARRPADDRPLSRAEVQEIQNRLIGLGYAPGTPDGVVGAQTRAAIRDYQRAAKQPPDGYPTEDLLKRLRRSASN